MTTWSYFRSMQTLPAFRASTPDDLAVRVAAAGVDSDRAGVAAVVQRATRLGADPVLLEIVIDPREPHVARQRAFGELLWLLQDDADATRPVFHDSVGQPASPVRAA
jgi:hypothetical protein